MGVKVGEVFLSVTPDTSAFATSLSSSLAPILANLATKVPITGDATGLENVLSGAKTHIKGILALGGIALGGKAVVDFLGNTVSAARTAEQAQRNVNVIFKDNAGAIVQWAQGAATSVGLSTGAAETMAATTANILEGFGVSTDFVGKHTTDVIKRMADVGSRSGRSIDDVQGALDSALAGRTRGLKQFGVVIDATMIKDQAARMGMTTRTVDADKVMRAQDALTLAQDNYNRTVAKAKDPNALALANNKVTLAYSHQQKALHDSGAGSAAYLSATDSLMSAQDNLTTAQNTQADSADALKLAQDRVTEAQGNLNDAAAGTADALTPEQTAMATLQLFMDHSTDAANLFGQTNVDQAQIAGASWDNAQETIGKAIDPIVSKLQVELGGWIRDHQGDIQNFAETLARGFQKAADVVQFLLDHKDALIGALAAFGVLHELGASDSWFNNIKRGIQTILGIGGGGGAAGGINAPVLTELQAQTVAIVTAVEGGSAAIVTAVETRGIGGFPGGQPGNPPGTILGPNGKPLPSTPKPVEGPAPAGVATAADEAAAGTGRFTLGELLPLAGISMKLMPSPNDVVMTGPNGAAIRAIIQAAAGGADAQAPLAGLEDDVAKLVAQGKTIAQATAVVLGAPLQQAGFGGVLSNEQRSTIMSGLSQQILTDLQVAHPVLLTPQDAQNALGPLWQQLSQMQLHVDQSDITNAFGPLFDRLHAMGLDAPVTPAEAGAGASAVVATAAKTIFNSLTPYAHGGVVPHTMAALLHGGETVVPAGASGGTSGGLTIESVTIVNPSSDVDPITAIQRGVWHATYDERGFMPSGASYRADQQPAGRA